MADATPGIVEATTVLVAKLGSGLLGSLAAPAATIGGAAPAATIGGASLRDNSRGAAVRIGSVEKQPLEIIDRDIMMENVQ